MAVTEFRTGATPLEVREAGDTVSIEGYASTFDQPYDMGYYSERVAPGAFTRSLGRKPDVRLLINHDGLPLARTASGTLHLSEDSTGLLVRADLDRSDPDVQSLLPKMRRGDLNQMSFGFRVDGKDGQSWSEDHTSRTLRALDIHDGDVSVVTFPANGTTSVGIRSAKPSVEPLMGALADFERRNAPEAEVVEFLTRALTWLRGEDAPTAPETEEPAEESPVEESSPELDEAERAARLATERRIAMIRALVA